MKLDNKKSVFKVITRSTKGWGTHDVVIIANDYNHARDLAQEYLEFEAKEKLGENVLTEDNSLNTESDEKFEISGIEEIFKRVIY